MTITNESLTRLIRDVPDFPKPGIVFKDITPLLADAAGFRKCIDLLAERVIPHRPESLVGIESRGFIFAAALAMRLELGIELVRKKGKLPYKTTQHHYDLEYGTDTIEMHTDAVRKGRRYAIIDDVIATGGTARAAADLIERQGGQVACFAFLIELGFLGGVARLGSQPVERVLAYE
jgi:adenine phosphoribosyltransferase